MQMPSDMITRYHATIHKSSNNIYVFLTGENSSYIWHTVAQRHITNKGTCRRLWQVATWSCRDVLHVP